MSPDKNEIQTRAEIDRQLQAAGWTLQDRARLDLSAGQPDTNGIAVREMDTRTGPADYMLFIQGKACGIIEAKREGTPLGLVAEQSDRYAAHAQFVQTWSPPGQPLPFVYEATNNEIQFRDQRDPHPRSRRIFHFHRPETL
ncbi:MAG: restriction endonuclease subunit R, partial [Acidobacteria bacterium]|nr:restriction endonuclease subunit R [Acidobacteriota bacterium]